ncbi:MAG: hypothetical protein NTW85_05320 [Methylococcales bacterium]|nr:hypothetical protein [Methylococcales bacterium]
MAIRLFIDNIPQSAATIFARAQTGLLQSNKTNHDYNLMLHAPPKKVILFCMDKEKLELQCFQSRLVTLLKETLYQQDTLTIDVNNTALVHKYPPKCKIRQASSPKT